MKQKSFGERLDGVVYKDREGAYGIGFDDEMRVPVVKTSTGYFLLGGGLEGDESHEECIKRECLEEAGLDVEVIQYVCKGDKFHWSDTLHYYMHGIGNFYYIHILKKLPIETEPDHELVWLTVEECKNLLFLEHQAWAVEEVVQYYKNRGI